MWNGTEDEIEFGREVGMTKSFVFRSALLVAMILAAVQPAEAADVPTHPEPIVPRKVTPLWNGKDLSGLTTWLKDTQRADPRSVFKVTDEMIHLTGDGVGEVCTVQQYRDYHLVVEYKWGRRTDGGKFVRN